MLFYDVYSSVDIDKISLFQNFKPILRFKIMYALLYHTVAYIGHYSLYVEIYYVDIEIIIN